MNIVEVSIEDHDEIENLVKKCSYGRSPATKEKYFVELKQFFEIHSFIEQLIFHPALVDAGIDPAPVRARQEEIVKLMAELDALTPEDELWTEKFRVIKKVIEGYIEEEETGLLRSAQKQMDPVILEKLGAEVVAKTAEQKAVQ